MLNFYEFLKISPNASTTEVQVAWDELYNQSRRLATTHHDPQIVQQANQVLLTLNEVRSTLLTDPTKRANYDATLSASNIGGVADPSAQSQGQGAAFAPPRITPLNIGQTGMVSQPVSGGWLCPQCNTISPIGTKFCKKCGQTLGKDCPKCHTLLEVSAQFCSECGVNIRDFERELEIQTAEANAIQIAEQKRLAQIEATLGPIKRSADTAATLWKIGCFLSLCSYGLGGIPFWVISLISAQKVLSASQTYGDTVYRQKAGTARIVSGIALGLIGLGILFYIFAFIVQLFSQRQ